MNVKVLLSLTVLALLKLNSYGGITIINGMSHEYQVKNGDQIEGQISIKNVGNKVARVLLYKTNLFQKCNGITIFTNDSSHARSSQSWVEIGNSEIFIEPQSEATVIYKLKVPEAGDKTGSFWSVIMVEEADQLDSAQKSKGIQVSTIVRYGIQIISSFASGATRDLEFQKITQDTSDGMKTLKIDVYNSGNTMVRPSMVLELYDGNGEQKAREELLSQKVYPGSCKTFTIPMEKVPPGEYNGILVADCGEEDVFGMNLNLQVAK